MFTVTEFIIVSFFIVWSAVCLLVQIPFIRSAIRKYDSFSLIPEWRFFAPRSGEHDYYFLYRDLDIYGGISVWHEIKLLKKRSWWNFIWNPNKRATKALFDLVVELSRVIINKDDTIELSIPYISLLSLITNEPRISKSVQTQFMILMRKVSLEGIDSQVLFISKLHDLI